MLTVRKCVKVVRRRVAWGISREVPVAARGVSRVGILMAICFAACLHFGAVSVDVSYGG